MKNITYRFKIREVNFLFKKSIFFFFCFFSCFTVYAQTFTDGQMMGKGLFCGGLSYTQDSWKNYWEGTLKRNNLNLGTVSTQSLAGMGALGVSKNINLMFV